MRILHTANTYAPSLDGVAEVVRNISERLAKRGHEVHIATSAIRSADSYTDLRRVRVHRFSVRGNLAFGMNGGVEKYSDFVRNGRWDILVNHGLHTWPTDALLDQIGAYPWPSILVTHGLVDEHPSFREYYSMIPRHISNYYKWIRVSGCSGEAAYSKAFNLPMPPIITNGVDMDEWARPPLGLRHSWGVGQKPWVVYVSNHSPLKCHNVFFRLADSLRNLRARFTLIAGTYPMAKWRTGPVRNLWWMRISMQVKKHSVAGHGRSKDKSATRRSGFRDKRSRFDCEHVQKRGELARPAREHGRRRPLGFV